MATKDSALKDMVQPKSFDEAIKLYLDNYAKGDEVWAEKYKNSGKTVGGCIKWIYGELLKMVKREGQYAAMGTTNEDIYSAAIHYFDEDSIKECTTMPKGVMVQTQQVPEPGKKEAPKLQLKSKKSETTKTSKTETPKTETSKTETSKSPKLKLKSSTPKVEQPKEPEEDLFAELF